MFGSRSESRRSYQVIDDDYDDRDTRSLLPNQDSLLPITHSRLRYMGNDEPEPPRRSATDPEVGYQGLSSSMNHSDWQTSSMPGPSGLTLAAPPSMASSSNQEHRWEHVENLDQFFTRVYEYHQGGGFVCIATKHVFSLFQFIFIVVFSTFFLQCIDYDVLFRNKSVDASGIEIKPGEKRHFGQAVVPNCASHLNPVIVFSILVAVAFWITRVCKTAYLMLQYKEIQEFYKDALHIEDSQLANLTWHSVVKRVCEVQPRIHLIVNHDHISPVDVYHRILRFKNYFTAMVNRRILPPVLTFPFIGEIHYLPNGLKKNLEWLLFRGYFSPWKGPYMLKDEIMNDVNLEQITIEMEKTVTYLGVCNLVLFPLIFLYQMLYSFFTLADMIKREPGSIGMRRYSNYGRYRLRHFNELEHELCARLNRSHRSATAYLEQFFSPLGEIVARNVAFVAGALFGVLAVLSAWDEDVIQIEHVLTVMTVCGVIVVVCRGLISDENLVFQPEVLLTNVASEVHYLPPAWKGQAHTDQVRSEFEQLFQLKSFHLLIELSSPIITPFILLFWVRPACSHLVRFLHDYSEGVPGLGHVCTFAMMDVARHGDPTWNNPEAKEGAQPQPQNADPALDGKTELSVLHFAATNPEWEPPVSSQAFIQRFKDKMSTEAAALQNGTGGNMLLESVHSMLLPLNKLGTPGVTAGTMQSGEGVSSVDGPLDNANGLFASISRSNAQASSLQNSLRQSGVDVDTASSDMRVQALFIRELHNQSVRMSHQGYMSTGPGATESIFGVPQMSQFEQSGSGSGPDFHTALAPNTMRSSMAVSSQMGRSSSNPVLPLPSEPPLALRRGFPAVSGSEFRGLGRLHEHEEEHVNHGEEPEHQDNNVEQEEDEDEGPPTNFNT